MCFLKPQLIWHLAKYALSHREPEKIKKSLKNMEVNCMGCVGGGGVGEDTLNCTYVPLLKSHL